MNWFSNEHKKIYSEAFNALCKDVKKASTSLIDTTGKVVSVGYNKIKEGADYLDKKYHDIESNTDTDGEIGESTYSYESTEDIDGTEDTEESILEIGKLYPDVLIKLHRNHNISGIWVIDKLDEKIKVTGKISSYPFVDKIIHEWFEYVNRDRGYKWYPTNDLYTSYRESSTRLKPINNIIFRYSPGHEKGYRPYCWNET